MDANKLKMLKRVSYRILKTCRTCLHGRFAPGSEWGTCCSWYYHHRKHDEVRALSIHICGGCPSWEIDEAKMGLLGGFRELLIDDGVSKSLPIGIPDPHVNMDFDLCECGDYRYQHRDNSVCQQFKLAIRCGQGMMYESNGTWECGTCGYKGPTMEHECRCIMCGGVSNKPDPRLAKKLRAERAATGDLSYCERCGNHFAAGTYHNCMCTRCCDDGETPLPCPLCGKVTG